MTLRQHAVPAIMSLTIAIQILGFSTDTAWSQSTAVNAEASQASLPESQTTGSSPTEGAEPESTGDTSTPSWSLFHTQCIQLGGWSQTGFHTRSDGMFNNSPDAVRQHQTWLYAEKAADGGDGLGLGFRIDYVYGTDGPDTQAFGNSPGTWDIDWDNGG